VEDILQPLSTILCRGTPQKTLIFMVTLVKISASKQIKYLTPKCHGIIDFVALYCGFIANV